MYAPDWLARFSMIPASRLMPREGLAALRLIGLGKVTASRADCRADSLAGRDPEIGLRSGFDAIDARRPFGDVEINFHQPSF
jgi:hypothetical protein